MDQLAFIQISDLHFGDKIGNNEFGSISGFRSHDYQLCRGLAEATEDVRSQLDLKDERLGILISGDVTATGSDQEFLVAHSFIMCRWRLRLTPPNEWAGLDTGERDLVSIPGNHDHWNGRKIMSGAYNSRIIGKHFHRTPSRKIWESTEGGLELELFCLDSNSGMEGKWSNQRARGRVHPDEFEELEQLLKKSDRELKST